MRNDQAGRRAGRRGFGARTRLAATLAVLCLCASGRAVGQTMADEYRLKAAFVLRFPQFVEWPMDALDGEGTFDLCVLDPDPFGPALSEMVSGEVLGTRPMTVRRIRPADPFDGCHVLYIPARATRREAILQRLTMKPILTISDAPRFLDEGGIVQLRLDSSRVRFDVSTAAAGRAGLRISAQLLQLAGSVRSRP
jgi:hypothetical protein